MRVRDRWQAPPGSPPALQQLPSSNEMMHQKAALSHSWSLSTPASATPTPQRPHLLRSPKILQLLKLLRNSWCLFLISKVPDVMDHFLKLSVGRSPGGGHGNPLQYSCLESPMGRGACWVTVHKVAKSWIRLKRLSLYAVSFPASSGTPEGLSSLLGHF